MSRLSVIQVVDLLHPTRRELGVDFLMALSSGYHLAPGLGGKSVLVRSWTVPAAALGYVVDAGNNLGGQFEGRV